MSDVDEVNFDHDRQQRIGLPEAVLSEHKSTSQLMRIIADVTSKGQPLLLTRLTEMHLTIMERMVPDGVSVDVCDVSRTAFIGKADQPLRDANIAVVSAGSSDVPVAKEAVRTLSFMGVAAHEVYDVGVAGLHRYLARAPKLREMNAVIVCAGMDAALVSVIGGDVPGVVIAVPTSVGYGVATGGQSALLASLASCASGVVVVNVDNGYGAACAALRACRLAET